MLVQRLRNDLRLAEPRSHPPLHTAAPKDHREMQEKQD